MHLLLLGTCWVAIQRMLAPQVMNQRAFAFTTREVLGVGFPISIAFYSAKARCQGGSVYYRTVLGWGRLLYKEIVRWLPLHCPFFHPRLLLNLPSSSIITTDFRA